METSPKSNENKENGEIPENPKKFSNILLNSVKSNNPDLNIKLFYAIKFKGFKSLGDFSKKAGFSTAYLSMIIHRKYKPTIPTAERICKVLRVGLTDIFNIPGDVQMPKDFPEVKKKKYPVIKAKIVDGLAQFYCPYCKRNHIHGAMSGMRASHCMNRESPLYSKDYYLEVQEDGLEKS